MFLSAGRRTMLAASQRHYHPDPSARGAEKDVFAPYRAASIAVGNMALNMSSWLK
jgi:hypothetical protein